MTSTKDAVTAAEIIRNFGYWQQQALTKPLIITHHGRARVMLVSVDEFDRLNAANTPSARLPLDEAEVRLATVVENMAEGFIAYDQDLRIRSVNAVAEAYFGVSRALLIGKTADEATGRTSNKVVNEILKRVLRSGVVETYDAGSTMFPGRKLRARAFPYLDGVATLALNITEQEFFRSSAAEWDAAQTMLGEMKQAGVAKLDTRGNVISTDAQFVRLTGFSAEDMEEARLFDIIDNADRRRTRTTFENVISNRDSSMITVKLVTRSGDVSPLKLAMAPLTVDFTPLGVLMMIAPPT